MHQIIILVFEVPLNDPECQNPPFICRYCIPVSARSNTSTSDTFIFIFLKQKG